MKKAKMTFMAILASFAMVGAGAAVAFVANPVAIVETKAASTSINTNAVTCGNDYFGIAFEKGDGAATPALSDGHVKMYGNNTMTITAKNGELIQSISFVIKVNLKKGNFPSPITSNHGSVSSYDSSSTSLTVTNVGGAESVVLLVDSASGGNIEFTSCTITYDTPAPEAPLESITVGGTVAAKTLDTEWDVSGVTVTGHYQGGGTSNLTDQCDIEVAEAVPAIASSGSTTVHVTATLKTDDTMTDTKALTANLTAIPLGCDQLYTADVGDEVTVIGKFLASYLQNGSHQAPDGVFIGNGDYGAIIYKSDSSLEGVTTDSYIKATGVISEYKGLREIGSNTAKPTFEVISAETAAPYCSAPQDYTVTGTEANKNLANRQTLVRGTVASVSGTFASDTDTTVTITLANSKSAKVFLKRNQGDVIDYSGLSTALTEGKEVTIKGILSIYSGDATIEPADFQVILPQLVEKDPAITAEVFCASLMSETDAICATAESGRHDALVTAWSDLKNNTFARMTDAEIERLKSAAANYNNTSENPLENAMGRYNYLTKKYNLDNFLERDLTDAPVASYLRVSEINNGNHAAGIAVASIIVASALTVGAVFAIRRKKKAE